MPAIWSSCWKSLFVSLVLVGLGYWSYPTLSFVAGVFSLGPFIEQSDDMENVVTQLFETHPESRALAQALREKGFSQSSYPPERWPEIMRVLKVLQSEEATSPSLDGVKQIELMSAADKNALAQISLPNGHVISYSYVRTGFPCSGNLTVFWVAEGEEILERVFQDEWVCL